MTACTQIRAVAARLRVSAGSACGIGLIERACNLCGDNVQLDVSFLWLLRSSYADPEPSPRAAADDAPLLARNAGLSELSNDVNRKAHRMELADLGLVPNDSGHGATRVGQCPPSSPL